MLITKKKLEKKEGVNRCANNTTLICIDCVDPYRAIRVLEFCKSQMTFKKVVFLTSFDVFYEHVVNIPRIVDKNGYSEFVLRDMDKYYDTEYCLIVQHDGFILNPLAFSEEFFSYDYMGGVTNNGWANGVGGNGGFSFRSKKLTSYISNNYEELSKIQPQKTNTIIKNYKNEDIVICVTLKDHLLSRGFRIANDDVQKEFSKDYKRWNYEFGFHGFTNDFSENWDRLHGVSLEKTLKSTKRSRKLVDCIMIHNELDILELRLMEIYDDVDYIVITESEVTFTGHDKPLYYRENITRFAPWNDKIIHLVVKKELVTGMKSPWSVEKFQRDYAVEYLKNTFDQDDYVVCADVDEIPKIKKLSKFMNNKDKNISRFTLDMSYHVYSLNSVVAGYRWRRAFVATVEVISASAGIDALRQSKPHIVEDCGWHFSYVTSPKNIINKLKSFSHTEYATGKYIESSYIEECIQNKKFFIWDDNNEICAYPNSELPDSVSKNPLKWRSLLSESIFRTE